VNERRIRLLGDRPTREGPVLYWMSRDQRVSDNWALLFAQDLALERKKPLGVLFCLVPRFLHATTRQYHFMLEGLHEVEQDLAKANVAFFLLAGAPEKEIPRFVAEHEVGTLVTDFDPLRVKRAWRQSVADKIEIAFYETCGQTGSKQQAICFQLRTTFGREFTYPERMLCISRHSRINRAKPLPVAGPENYLDISRAIN
jgi:deoxyribodipyrimidine photolyase